MVTYLLQCPKNNSPRNSSKNGILVKEELNIPEGPETPEE